MTLRETIIIEILKLEFASDAATIRSMSQELGIDSNEYDYRVHYPIYCARVCAKFADIFIAELNRLKAEKAGEGRG